MTMRYPKYMLLSLVVVLVLVLQPGSSSGQQEYVIGEGDLLKITVYDNLDLTTEARISGDGKITFPLIGEVVLNGLRVNEAEKTIAKLLEDGYVVKPQVSIFIAEYKSKKVTVLGEVGKPGIVVLRGASTLMEVISDAGGITLNAGDAIVITRKLISISTATAPEKFEKETGKNEISVIVDTKRLFEDGDVSANVPVQAGDSIYVPRAAFVYVNGEVKNPGAYKITKGLTVLKAITIAGGFTVKASESRTRIIRKTDAGEIRIKAKFDDLVLPDDIIQIPESFF